MIRIAIENYVRMAVGVGCALAAFLATAENAIQSVNAVQQGDTYQLRIVTKEPLASIPNSFSVAEPARIVLDFPQSTNAVGKPSQSILVGDLRSVNLVQVDDRTRVVINMLRAAAHEIALEGNAVVVTVRPTATTRSTEETARFSQDRGQAGGLSVSNISFRRGANGEGKIVVDLSDPRAGIDIQQQGSNLIIGLANTKIPESIRRRYDVTDFATPITGYVVSQHGGNAKIAIQAKGLWEHTAYQSDSQFVVEVKQLVEDPNKLVQSTKQGYQGEKLSLNFQNVDVRRLLQVIGEFTGMNIVVSDTVGGSITLILKDVPWDQALDIVLQQKGLDMRKNGNVILIAPRDELATKEKLELEAKQQIGELEPVKSESFQLNYQKAEDVQKLLSDKDQRLLSKRGGAIVDARTNTLFVQDISAKLEDVRQLIRKIDVPVRQVLIEARIVEATDTFSRNLGVRLGVVDLKGAQDDGRSIGNNRFTIGGQMPVNAYLTGQSSTKPDFSSSYGVNLPAAALDGGKSPAGVLSLSLFNASRTSFLNMELTALEGDGRGKIISSPRLMTADQNEAVIEQGVELPYLQASSAGAANVAYKKAVLSLKVKPSITPEGKVIMKLQINKDSPNTTLNTGAGLALDTKKIMTEVLVENGGTVVIGGIYQQQQLERTRKIPLLGDLPVFGWAFKNNEVSDDKTELMIFISPRIIAESLTGSASPSRTGL